MDVGGLHWNNGTHLRNGNIIVETCRYDYINKMGGSFSVGNYASSRILRLLIWTSEVKFEVDEIGVYNYYCFCWFVLNLRVLLLLLLIQFLLEVSYRGEKEKKRERKEVNKYWEEYV